MDEQKAHSTLIDIFTATPLCEWFSLYHEVSGEYLFHTPRTDRTQCRIDFILCPKKRIIVERGWDNGIIGVECKGGEHDQPGRTINQIWDYTSAVFSLPGGVLVKPFTFFIYPFAPFFGDIASFLCQHRIGTIDYGNGRFCMKLGSQNVFSYSFDTDEIVVSNVSSGLHRGSR